MLLICQIRTWVFKWLALSLCQFKTGSVRPLSLAYNLNLALCQLRLDFTAECRKGWVSKKTHCWVIQLRNDYMEFDQYNHKINKSCSTGVYMSAPHYHKCVTWRMLAKTLLDGFYIVAKKHKKRLFVFFLPVLHNDPSSWVAEYQLSLK